MAINNELTGIYEYVGGLLSGRSITLQQDAPAAIGANGTVSRDGAKCFIRMNQDLLPGDRLKTYLHEIAHARLHFDTIPSSKHHEKPAQSFPAGGYTPAEIVEEQQADKMANQWLDYARGNASPWLEPEIAHLKALAEYAQKYCWHIHS